MKILIGSDFHMEFSRAHVPEPPSPDDYDVVVLAGDIDYGCRGADWAAEKFTKPVVIVLGNHEAYQDRDFAVLEQKLLGYKHNIYPLVPGNRRVVIDSVLFTGGTLWSQCDLEGYCSNPLKIQTGISDFRTSKFNGKLLTVNAMRNLNLRDIDDMRIAQDGWTGKKVYVTHFLPTQKCIHPKYIGDSLNPYFCNDLDWMITEQSPDVWIFGHTHERMDFMCENTRMVCNSSGYPGENKEPWSWKIIEI